MSDNNSTSTSVNNRNAIRDHIASLGRSIDTHRTLFIPTGSHFTDMILVAQSRNTELIKAHKHKIRTKLLIRLSIFSAVLIPVTAVIFTQTDHEYWAAIPLSVCILLIGYNLLVFFSTIRVLNSGLQLAQNPSEADLETGQNCSQTPNMAECRQTQTTLANSAVYPPLDTIPKHVLIRPMPPLYPVTSDTTMMPETVTTTVDVPNNNQPTN